MAMCLHCHGTGRIDGAGRDPCYTCGGRGTGCTACGGTGVGSRPRQETCWGCGGTGQQADSAVTTTHQRGNTARQRVTRPKKPWSRDEIIVLVPAYAVSAWGLVEYANLTGWLPFAIALLPAAIIARMWKALVVLSLAGAAIWAMDLFSKS